MIDETLSVQNAWTLWFFKNDKARTWEENQRPILTGSDYSFFKVGIPDSGINLQYFFVFIKYNLHQEGIFPDWEDEKNGPGGRWIINSDK